MHPADTSTKRATLPSEQKETSKRRKGENIGGIPMTRVYEVELGFKSGAEPFIISISRMLSDVLGTRSLGAFPQDEMGRFSLPLLNFFLGLNLKQCGKCSEREGT